MNCIELYSSNQNRLSHLLLAVLENVLWAGSSAAVTSWCESSLQTLAGPSHCQGGLSCCQHEVSLQKLEVKARFIRLPSFLLTSFQCMICGCYQGRCSEGRSPSLETGLAKRAFSRQLKSPLASYLSIPFAGTSRGGE